jgi:hypothetical protein
LEIGARSSTPAKSVGAPIHDSSTKPWEVNNKIFNKMEPFIAAKADGANAIGNIWETLFYNGTRIVLHRQLTANLNHHRSGSVADLK